MSTVHDIQRIYIQNLLMKQVHEYTYNLHATSVLRWQSDIVGALLVFHGFYLNEY